MVVIKDPDDNIRCDFYESVVNLYHFHETWKLRNVPWLAINYWLETSLVSQ